MTTEETILRLENEIEVLRDKMSATSKFAAVNDINDQKDPLVAARQLLELREVLKLKQVALSEARSILESEQSAANQAEQDQQRDQICELTDQLESEAKKLLTSVKKIARHYAAICDIESQIKTLGQTATDWPKEAFQYTRPGDAVY
ncbi:MAG: hypothetical protein ACON5J_19850, partial [Rubripirellula sp.]